MTGGFDLFGHPVANQDRGPGRPPHVPTAESRAMVRRMRGEGAQQTEIGAALGLTGKTLRLHYHEELGSRSQVWRLRAIEDGERDDG